MCDVTRLLQAWGAGDEAALEQLLPLVYDEIHRRAHRYMAAERPGHGLQTTVLINELYLRLVDINNVDWQDRNHFYALCARLMRRILVDFARARSFQKRGGGAVHVDLDRAPDFTAGQKPEILAVHEALTRLATVDSRKSDVVELRFFGGFTVEETADILGVSEETVTRDWRMAKAWLLRELASPATP